LLSFIVATYGQTSGNALLKKGWEALVKDNDDDAFRYFWAAHEQAEKQRNTQKKPNHCSIWGFVRLDRALKKAYNSLRNH
jgi:hypothetical protein